MTADLAILAIDVIKYDMQLFEFINSGMSNPIFDAVLTPARNKYIWIPFYIFILAFVGFNYKENKLYFYVFAALTVISSDQLSSNLIKKTVKRIRPCNEIQLEQVVVERVHCSTGYSFTSSHATNHFAVATFLFLSLSRYLLLFRWPILVWAGVIAFAQIYVGVHYPIDILCGTILGIIVGYIFGTILASINR